MSVDGNCSRCGLLRKQLHVDHIVPKWMFYHGYAVGDPEAESNKQLLCANCHEDKTVDEWSTSEWREVNRKTNTYNKARNVEIGVLAANKRWTLLADDAVLAIRASTVAAKVLAEQYDVRVDTIYSIRRGETYKHVRESDRDSTQ
jgi:hypothetical protein